MNKILFALSAPVLTALLIIPFGFAYAASVDYYIKIDDIEGESTSNSSDEAELEARDSQGGSDSSEKKGNVEVEFKVEKGESMEEGDPDRPLTGGNSETEGIEPDEIDFRDDDSDDDSIMEDEDDHGNTISVRAVEVRGWDSEEKEAFMNTVKTHAQVQSGEDLENFAKGVLLEDESVESVSFDDGKIEVKYKAQARLFGFIPFRFTETIRIEANEEEANRIQVRFPWYSFLLSSDISAADLKDLLAEDLDNENVTFNPLATGGTGDMSVEGNASVFAQALEALSNALKARHEAAMNSVRNLK